jgi:hypothetical protein
MCSIPKDLLGIHHRLSYVQTSIGYGYYSYNGISTEYHTTVWVYFNYRLGYVCNTR